MLNGKVLVSSGRSVEDLIIGAQSQFPNVAKLDEAVETRTFKATNPNNDEDRAFGNIKDLLGVGVPIGPVGILVSMGLEVGEAWEEGPVRIERTE